MQATDVQAKAEAATLWYKSASDRVPTIDVSGVEVSAGAV